MTVWEEERKHFPLIQGGELYLDCSTSGMIADYSYEAMERVLRSRMEHGMNIEEYFDRWRFMDELREEIGRMVNCKGRQVVYGMSSTQLLNILANGLDWKPGDNVVTTDITYYGDSYLWMAKEGVGVKFAKTEGAYISAEDLLACADGHTRVVCITMVENKFGFRHDLEAIGALCRERGIFFAVDGTQGVNALHVDMQRMNIDFLAVSSYKWMMNEVGAGFACIGEELLPRLAQCQTGWVGTENRRENDCQVLHLSEDAKRFEFGGPNFLGYYGLAETVKRNLRLGGGAIEAYILSMVNEVYDRAERELNRIRIYRNYPKKNRSQVISFVTPPELPVSTEQLQKMGLRCRVFDGHLIRIGFHYCNIPADIDVLFACLRRLENL